MHWCHLAVLFFSFQPFFPGEKQRDVAVMSEGVVEEGNMHGFFCNGAVMCTAKDGITPSPALKLFSARVGLPSG